MTSEVGGLSAGGMTPADDDRIFAELYPALRRFAAIVRPPEVEADDLVQEALVRTLSLRPLSECENPDAYLRTAIVRIASNHRRSLGRRRRALTRSTDSEAGRDAVYPSDLDDLRRLHVRDRAVLYLSLVEGRPYRDIAQLLGCTEEAARARAARGLRKLRVELRQELSDE